MMSNLVDFKYVLERECAISRWSPSEEQLLLIAFDITQKGSNINKGDVYTCIKSHYKDDLYITVKKGLGFQKMINLLEVALKASEAIKNDGGESK